MSLQKFWVEDDEEGCFSCGELDYMESLTPGLCVMCNPSDPRHFKYLNVDDYE